MISDDFGSDSTAFLKEMYDIQQQKETDIEKKVIPCLKREEIPTPDDIRGAINSMVGEARQRFLRHHVYWKERQLRLGLESLVRAAHHAHVDICRHDAALGSLARARDFESHVNRTVGYAAQKDVMAYCSLAIGVSDTLRRIKKRRSDIKDEIQHVSDEYFDHDVTFFVQKLRTNLFHGSVAIPHWQISFGPGDRAGSMVYSKEALLGFGEWNKRAKKYVLNNEGHNINLSKIIGDHFKLLDDFYRKMEDLFARNVTHAEEDFYEIEDSHKRIAKRQWAKILISQIGKTKDPYDYLHRCWTSC
ncbi:hypothetical protein NKDENANG_00215 [Candidatus Entotheonellaceae bacterium PAL068K]